MPLQGYVLVFSTSEDVEGNVLLAWPLGKLRKPSSKSADGVPVNALVAHMFHVNRPSPIVEPVGRKRLLMIGWHLLSMSGRGLPSRFFRESVNSSASPTLNPKPKIALLAA